jgi:AraC-like DNA-binding protein
LKNSTRGTNVSFHYIETEEAAIASGSVRQLPFSQAHRFVTCPQADVRVTLDNDEGHQIIVAPSELFYIPNNVSFTITNCSSSDTRVIMIYFQVNLAMQPAAWMEHYVLMGFRLPQMKNWLKQFVAEIGSYPLSDYLLLQSRLYSIAAACLKSQEKPAQDAAQSTLFVEQIKQHILKNYESALDMDKLARSLDISVNRFYQTFRKHTGHSPLKFVITTRLNASLRLLADPQMSVNEAAHSVGYSDEYYFSRLFKKHMGITPTKYASCADVAIANLSPIFVGDLKVLGLTPRLTLKRDWDLENDRIDAYMMEIKSIEPQIILTGPISDALFKELNKIAPVTMINWYEMPWTRRLTQLGQLLGLESIANRFLSDFQDKIMNARKYVEEHFLDTPFLLLGVREDSMRIYGPLKRKFTDLLYDELHFKAPPAMADVGFVDVVSVKEAAEFTCDNVLFLIEFPASDSFCDQLEEEWKSAKTGREGRGCFFIRLEEPFLYNAAMHELLVDQTVSHLHAVKITK